MIDVTENKGTLDFKEAGDGDLSLGEAGRNTIEVYKVTLPAPPKPRAK